MGTPAQDNKNRRLVKKLSFIALGMFVFGFALVPLYDVFCDITGLNGKTGGQASASKKIDKSRWVRIEFLAQQSPELPWQFGPKVQSMRVHPGENTRMVYLAKNNSAGPMTVQAVPSVSPGGAAQYLKKTQCFCFNRQTLKGGEAVEMPVLFHVDPDLPAEVKTLTLSYSLFDVNQPALKKTGGDAQQGSISPPTQKLSTSQPQGSTSQEEAPGGVRNLETRRPGHVGA